MTTLESILNELRTLYHCARCENEGCAECTVRRIWPRKEQDGE